MYHPRHTCHINQISDTSQGAGSQEPLLELPLLVKALKRAHHAKSSTPYKYSPPNRTRGQWGEPYGVTVHRNRGVLIIHSFIQVQPPRPAILCVGSSTPLLQQSHGCSTQAHMHPPQLPLRTTSSRSAIYSYSTQHSGVKCNGVNNIITTAPDGRAAASERTRFCHHSNSNSYNKVKWSCPCSHCSSQNRSACTVLVTC
jgi:hypothetical protein